jgi:hypothetical protein
MSKVEAESFGAAEIEFTDLPRDEMPDDELAVRRIVSGQASLLEFYRRASEELEDEARYLANLLRRDWERRSADLIAAGKEILERLGSRSKSRDELPARGQIEKAVAALRGATARRFHEVASRLADRAFLCNQVVPWVSAIHEVFEHFRRSLEAEDAHIAVIELLGGLIED